MSSIVARGLRWLPWVAAVIVSYYVVLGDAAYRDPHVLLRAVNAVVAGALLVVYVLRGPALADRIDKGVLLGVVLFSGASVLAQFPRQAFDSLLTVLVFAAALFVARTILARETARLAFVQTLMVLSATLTLLIAARWLVPVVEWAGLTGWSVLPPLDMDLPPEPWGHRHDVALLIVLLYPSWWIGRVSPLRASLATVVGVLSAFIVLFDGSRAVWMGVAIASAVLLVPILRSRWPRDGRRQLVILIAIAAVAIAGAVSGLAGALIDRLVAAASLGMRGAMWGHLLEAWSSRPVGGLGPGSFPWILQTTDYFDTNALAPRHPDSAPVQILAEGGLLGLAAMAALLVALVPPILRCRSAAARSALIVFAIASIFGNPTVFPFVVVVAIGWTAYALPREIPEQPPLALEPNSLVRMGALACLVIISAAWVSTAAADIAYGSARAHVANDDLASALGDLQLAERLDPGMAIYPRQLGTALLIGGDATAAIDELKMATQLNPSDQLAWRTLALAATQSGDPDLAARALANALDRRRSDPSNLLLAAAQGSPGDARHSAAVLAEIVQAWPTTIAAVGWQDAFPSADDSLQLVAAARTRWADEASSPQPLAVQPVLLSIMAGEADAAADAAEEALGPDLGPVYVAVMSCQQEARELIDSAPATLLRSSTFWSLAIRQAALEGREDETANRVYALMTGADYSPAYVGWTLNLLNENGADGYSSDRWGYRRTEISWPGFASLPSPWNGETRWLLRPSDAVEAANLRTVLTNCQ